VIVEVLSGTLLKFAQKSIEKPPVMPYSAWASARSRGWRLGERAKDDFLDLAGFDDGGRRSCRHAPMMRPAGAFSSASGEETRVYKDQLGELERDRERGLIAGDEAEAARVEIGAAC
jgi:Cytochrome c biogenesis factor